MKKTVLSFALVSATLFLGVARAAEPKVTTPVPPAPAMTMTADQAALLQRFDKNHDGRLDEDELAAAHETMLKQDFKGGPGGERGKKVRAALLKRFDKNGDGKLDEEERAGMKKYFLDRFDKNGDGRLDENERAAMREAFKAENKELKLKN